MPFYAEKYGSILFHYVYSLDLRHSWRYFLVLHIKQHINDYIFRIR